MAELDFVTAPHSIPGEEEQYGWWFSKVSLFCFGIAGGYNQQGQEGGWVLLMNDTHSYH